MLTPRDSRLKSPTKDRDHEPSRMVRSPQSSVNMRSQNLHSPLNPVEKSLVGPSAAFNMSNQLLQTANLPVLSYEKSKLALDSTSEHSKPNMTNPALMPDMSTFGPIQAIGPMSHQTRQNRSVLFGQTGLGVGSHTPQTKLEQAMYSQRATPIHQFSALNIPTFPPSMSHTQPNVSISNPNSNSTSTASTPNLPALPPPFTPSMSGGVRVGQTSIPANHFEDDDDEYYTLPSSYSTVQTNNKKRKNRPDATVVEEETSKKANRGLRHFSMKVCEKVRQLDRTSYNEVAESLVADMKAAGETEGNDEQNVRRRVYDALNVLVALGTVRKEKKKELVWVSMPNGSRFPVGEDDDKLLNEVNELKQCVAEQKEILGTALVNFVSQYKLVQRNKGRDANKPLPQDGLSMPFVLAATHLATNTAVDVSNDHRTVHFKFTGPFFVSEDKAIVSQLDLGPLYEQEFIDIGIDPRILEYYPNDRPDVRKLITVEQQQIQIQQQQQQQQQLQQQQQQHHRNTAQRSYHGLTTSGFKIGNPLQPGTPTELQRAVRRTNSLPPTPSQNPHNLSLESPLKHRPQSNTHNNLHNSLQSSVANTPTFGAAHTTPATAAQSHLQTASSYASQHSHLYSHTLTPTHVQSHLPVNMNIPTTTTPMLNTVTSNINALNSFDNTQQSPLLQLMQQHQVKPQSQLHQQLPQQHNHSQSQQQQQPLQGDAEQTTTTTTTTTRSGRVSKAKQM